MDERRLRVLLVEDDEDDYLLTRHMLDEVESPGYDLDWASTFDDGLEAIGRREHDVVLVDNRLGVHTGLELLQQAMAEGCKTPIIMLTGTAILDMDLAAMKAGAADYLEKDLLSARMLERSIRYAVQRRQVEEALARERALLRTLIDTLPDYIFVKDAEGRFILSNQAHAQAVNAPTPDALVGKTAFDFFPAELAAQFDADDRAIMQSGMPLISRERQTVNADGSRIWVSTTKVPLRDARGNVTGLVGISRNITDQKQAEGGLRESEERFRSLFEDSPISLWEQDLSLLKASLDKLRASGVQDFRTYFDNHPGAVIELLTRVRVVNVNKVSLKLYKATRKEQLLGYLSPDLLRESEAMNKELFIAITEGKTRFEGELVNYTLTGEQLNIALSWLVAPGHESTLSKVLVSIVDITERKQAEERRIQLELERTKLEIFKRFVGDVSHDLRTPLSIMTTSLYLLKKGADPDRQLRYVENLEEQTAHMQKIVEDLFTLSRLEMAASEFWLTPANLNTLAQVVCDQEQPLAARKQHQLSVNLAANLPPVLLDQAEFAPALRHLLVNALNYTPDGGQIAVSTYLDRGQVVFEVRDSGIGISAEDIPRIFERFYRVDRARAINTGGSGLGLAITRRIVEVHGGEIEVESTPDAGSVFRVRLPPAE